MLVIRTKMKECDCSACRYTQGLNSVGNGNKIYYVFGDMVELIKD